MRTKVQFFSYFRDLTGCEEAEFEIGPGTSLGELLRLAHERFPRLNGMEKSTLAAVGVEYQDREYELAEGDVVSLFPPVQGG